MALTHFLYGCPFCGEIPLRGKGSRAGCPSCARGFVQDPSGAGIRVREPEGESVRFTPQALARRLGELDHPWVHPAAAEPDVLIESTATARFSSVEMPIRFKGELLGLAERQGPKRRGVLRLFAARLEFDEVGSEVHGWPLRDIRALQASSSSIQVSPLEGGVLTFRFASHSPRLWEELLKARLRATWLDEGRGEIIEFQPRIRTE